MMTHRPRTGCNRPLASASLAWALLLTLGACAAADGVDDRLAALKAAGEPVTLAEAAPAPVPDDDNAALYWLDGCAALVPGGDDLYAGLDVDDPVVLGLVRSQVARDSEALAYALEAATRDRCRFPLEYEKGLAMMLPHLSQVRQMARFLRCAALASALDGDPAEAAERLRLGFVLARHVTQDPILIGLLVGIAIDSMMVEASAQVMALGRIPTRQAQALSAELGKLDYADCLVRALRTERCMGLQVFGQVQGGTAGVAAIIAGGEDGKEPAPEELEQYLQAGGLERDRLAYLDTLAGAIELAALPWRESKDRWEELEQSVAQQQGAPLAREFLPALGRVGPKRDEAVARRGLLQAALALIEDWYQDEQYPETLAAARTEEFAIPPDVFSDEEFIYKAEGGQVTLYSIGPNLQDDGGYWGNPEPGDDIAWPPAPKQQG